MDKLQKHIIDEFNSDTTQKIYVEEAEKGLWKSEEYLIKKYFKHNSSLLDIGCGTGRTTIPLFKMGYNITGVDISYKMIDNAIEIANNQHLKIKFEVGDATDLIFSSDRFDNALFSFNGWTQIPFRKKRIQALKEINRILKPGGHFIFTVNSRKIFGKYFFLWINQWIKIKIMKRLGYSSDEFEFGDLFFESQGRSKQFIHIPTIGDVKKDIRSASFKLLFYQKENKISGENSLDDSIVFFVCRKNYE